MGAPQFMSLLIKYYNEVYKVEGLAEPPEVNVSTTEYQKDSDHMLEFYNTYITKGSDKETISLDFIFTRFKSWFKDNYPEIKVTAKSILKKFLIDTIGKPGSGNIWTSYKFKDPTDSDDDELAHE